MFREKICLVLGAGASRPYGLPTSRQLRHILLGRDAGAAFENLGKGGRTAAKQYFDTVTSWGISADDLTAFQTEFFNAQRVSIDAFLSQRKSDFELVGRTAIATAILMCENQHQLNEDWYQWLLELLIREGPDFEANKLFIISFNYDRSVEFFLWRAFRASFGVAPDKADEMLQRIGIVHVYGDMGPLSGTGDIRVGYGDLKGIGRARDSIHIAAPGAELPSADQIQNFLAQCRRIVFLGFGFWKENLDILRIEQFRANKEIFASCLGLPRTIKMEVSNRFRVAIPGNDMNWGNDDQDVLKFLSHWYIFS
jgi:hypothetical protein